MLSVFPVAQFTYWLNQQIPLPEWADTMEQKASGMLEGLMVMDSPWEFLFNLLVMAVLPAVGEELMFRGIIQQKMEEQTKNGHLAIWITAVIFSAIHFQFEGFLARMVLGAALGYLFFWTRNLWIPIAAHFLTNALQVFVRYAFADKMAEMQAEAEEAGNIPWASALMGLFLVFLVGHYLQQRTTAAKAQDLESP
jgi:membrane protease YdiL (CAAX protease family)